MGKIDDFFYSLITKIVIRWIKKHKYLRHKYDFAITMQTWEAAFWVVNLFYEIYLGVKTHSYLVPGIWLLFSIAIIFMQVQRFQLLQSMKVTYDWVWDRRKNPMVYEAIKQITTDLYKEGRKTRKMLLAIHLILFIFMLAFGNYFLAIIYIFLTISIYYNHVFDFDEPDKKEKRQKDSLTDLALNSWRALVGGLSPVSIPLDHSN